VKRSESAQIHKEEKKKKEKSFLLTNHVYESHNQEATFLEV